MKESFMRNLSFMGNGLSNSLTFPTKSNTSRIFISNHIEQHNDDNIVMVEQELVINLCSSACLLLLFQITGNNFVIGGLLGDKKI